MTRIRGTAGGGASPTGNELRGFVPLAEELHFGRAADRLGVAQSSLSETIRRLEGKLDAVLFERTSRRVEPSAAGRRLLPMAREALAAMSAMQELDVRPAEAARTSPSPLRIGIEVPGVNELTGPLLQALRRRHPATPIAVHEFSCAHGFFDHDLDVAIVRTPVIDERLEVHPLASQDRAFILPAGHPAADADRLSVLDLQDEPFVALDERAPVARAYWLALERWGGELPRVGARAFTATEIQVGVQHLGAVAIGLSAPRDQGAMTVVEAADLSPNTVALAVRADDGRPIVEDVVRLAGDLVPRLAHLAPELTPLEALEPA
ncbi:LysR family transcriptional regulator [Miltoncostaea marina]|uniref:LysR family transcriptional regulator n=1 Tax=Miltoncostaea marina TaxID=2843215 RepID=UPI001C3CD411|nr:LysR family transcriptional regulator [Miltoncostaea marina]